MSFVLAENEVNDSVYIQLLSTPQPRGGYQLVWGLWACFWPLSVWYGYIVRRPHLTDIFTTIISYNAQDSGFKLPFSKCNKFLQCIGCIGFALQEGDPPHSSKVIDERDIIQWVSIGWERLFPSEITVLWELLSPVIYEQGYQMGATMVNNRGFLIRAKWWICMAYKPMDFRMFWFPFDRAYVHTSLDYTTSIARVAIIYTFTSSVLQASTTSSLITS